MSHSIETPYYNLPVFEADDYPSWLEDFNGAMNKIDTAIHEASITSGNGVEVVQTTGNSDTAVMSQNATTQALSAKQPTLISGQNIATINGQSLLNGGNLVIESGSGGGDNPTIDVVQTTGSSQTAVMSQNATTSALNNKQATLVSGTNIKTINGQTLLGNGDLTITGDGTETTPIIVTGHQFTSSATITNTDTSLGKIIITDPGTYLVFATFECNISSVPATTTGISFVFNKITKTQNGTTSDFLTSLSTSFTTRQSTNLNDVSSSCETIPTRIGIINVTSNTVLEFVTSGSFTGGTATASKGSITAVRIGA